VHRIKYGRPSPALLIALVALFVSLGGTGYAASQVTAGASKAKTSKLVTTAQVNKLIERFFATHRTELKGAQGSDGAAGKNGDAGAKGDKGDRGEKGDKGDTGDKGERGEIGPQGPGATSLVTTAIGNETAPVGTVGPWSITVTCNPSTPNSTLTIKGPGELSQSVTKNTSTAATSVAIGSGQTLQVNNGEHLAETGFLTSGSTTYQLNIQMTTENPGLFQSCPVVGDAIPVPAAS
jgi:hypothetical protein